MKLKIYSYKQINLCSVKKKNKKMLLFNLNNASMINK